MQKTPPSDNTAQWKMTVENRETEMRVAQQKEKSLFPEAEAEAEVEFLWQHCTVKDDSRKQRDGNESSLSEGEEVISRRRKGSGISMTTLHSERWQ